jgi:3'-phosphoadenosine 5'-phosphosulfate sulfotransferase (PAPS reductase)/FAD synthetase
MNTFHAIDTIKKALGRARRPAVLWSGGKDSTVLLDLCLTVRPDIEVIHFKLPFLSHKYKHHHEVQEELKLTVHDWVPSSIALTHGNNRIDVCETYSLGSSCFKVMRGTEMLDLTKPWVCGKEWLNRPKANVVNDFDILFCGHKNSDQDPLTGKVPLMVDMKFMGNGTEMWFPLREWTDEDVSLYITSSNIKYDQNRYDSDVVSRPDKHMNSDYVHACFRCIDRRESAFVHCPKLNADVENLHEFVLHEEPVIPYCNVRTGLSKVRGVLQPQGQLADSAKG